LLLSFLLRLLLLWGFFLWRCSFLRWLREGDLGFAISKLKCSQFCSQRIDLFSEFDLWIIAPILQMALPELRVFLFQNSLLNIGRKRAHRFDRLNVLRQSFDYLVGLS
jgi:hypothetical protein